MSRLKVAGRGLKIQRFGGFDGFKFRMRWRELVDMGGKCTTYENDKLAICIPRNPSHTFKTKAGDGAPELS